LTMSSKVKAWLSSRGKPSTRMSLAPDLIMALRSRPMMTCENEEGQHMFMSAAAGTAQAATQ
jgi:hypothetical protein